MGLPSKFFRLPKKSLEDALYLASVLGISVYRSSQGNEVISKNGHGSVYYGIEHECEKYQYLCLVLVHSSSGSLELFEKLCEIIIESGGVEIGGDKIPKT